MKISSSIIWLETCIDICIGMLVGFIFGVANYQETGMLTAIGGGIIGMIVFGLLYRILQAMWLPSSCTNRLIAASLPFGPGTGLITMLCGDIIRLFAFQLYQGDDPVDFAFFGVKSKWHPVGETTVNQPLYTLINKQAVAILDVRFTCDGEVLIVQAMSESKKMILELWDLSNGKYLYGGQAVFETTRDGNSLFIGNHDGEIGLWSASKKDFVYLKNSNSGPITAVGLSSDGKTLASGTKDGNILLLNTRDGTIRGEIKSIKAVTSLAFLPDGSILSAGTAEDIIHLWDTGTNQLIRTLPEKKSGIWTDVPIKRLHFSPDGNILAAEPLALTGNEGTRLWRIADGKKLGEFATSKTVNFALTPEEGLLCFGICEDKANVKWYIPLMRISDGKIFRTIHPDSSVWCTAITPTRDTLLAGSQGVVYNWSFPGGKLIRKVRASALNRGGSVNALAISSDGAMIATCSDDFLVRLWDLKTWTPKKTLHGHETSVLCAAFLPNGSLIASGDMSGIVKVWQTNGETPKIPKKMKNELQSRSSVDGSVKPDKLKIIVCPNCNMTVVVKEDGTCPSCRQPIEG